MPAKIQPEIDEPLRLEPLRWGRAPADRLLLVCLAAATAAYVAWLVALQIWPPAPEGEARQSFHGFVAGSSQPPAGPGERSPAAAGEYGSSKLGSSHYWFGGGEPRPIAEGAASVATIPVPEPESAPQPEPTPEPDRAASTVAAIAEPSPRPTGEAGAAAAELGRVGLRAWAHARAPSWAPALAVAVTGPHAAASPTRSPGPN